MRVHLNNFLTLSFVVTTTFSLSQFQNNKINHQPQQLNSSGVRYLAGLSDTQHIDDVLDNILIERVVGTPNHEKVFKYIKQQLVDLGWNVEVDVFKDETPVFGELTFRNIISTLNQDAERYLVLACHYDSKYYENEVFVGAIDSAVPCAMMLNLAKVMKTELDATKDQSDVGLKFIFFDGEEAFDEWGPRDSIYGARHLANMYDQNVSIAGSTGEYVNALDRMDVLVLLDLIGVSNPTFMSFFTNTERWYLRLADAEDRLKNLGLLENHSSRYFKKRRSYGRIEDDHIPFLRKNVPVLHIINVPFPSVWHTPRDNRDAIDMKAIENINKMLRIFVAEYLHLLPEEEHITRKIPEKEL